MKILASKNPLTVALALSLSTSWAAPTALAQQPSAGLEEVLVTARRRVESAQTVPVAVSSFQADDLYALQADALDSLQGAVPNLNLVQGRGSNSSANIFVRGIGQPDALQTFDPAVGVYVDDVYLSRIQGALMNLYDVERVEVLRGPQGTLYGKNTIAGAIKLVTLTPGEETRASVGVRVGSYDRMEAQGLVAGQIGEGLFGSVAARYSERDGIVDDYLRDREYNDDENVSVRGKLRWVPTDNLAIEFSADHTEEDVALTLGRLESTLIAIDTVTGGVIPLIAAPSDEYDFEASTSFVNGEGQELEHSGVSLTVDWAVSDAVTLKSISSVRSLETDSFIDIDATEFQVGDVFVGVDQDQFSQEFQVLYDDGGAITAVAGLYYMEEDVESDQIAFADDLLQAGGIPLAFRRDINDELETTSYAVFGQLGYAFNEQWSLTTGLRYTLDEKDYFRATTTTFDPVPFAFEDDDDWDEVTPSIALDYQQNDRTLWYLSAAKGFKSGGFNGRANTVFDTGSFDPETVWTYEVGNKWTSESGMLRINSAAFYSDYQDFQARVAESIESLPVINAAELDIYGAELEVAFMPVDGLTLSSQVGYLDSEYNKFEDARQPDGDRSDDTPPFSPEWTARFAALYQFSLTAGSSITVGVDTQFRDEMYLSVDNQDALTQDSYWLSNAFVGFTSADQHWEVVAGVKNLADEVYKTDAQEFSSVGNIQTAYYGDPRTYSLSLTYNY